MICSTVIYIYRGSALSLMDAVERAHRRYPGSFIPGAVDFQCAVYCPHPFFHAGQSYGEGIGDIMFR